MVGLSARGSGTTTATVGIAWSSVHPRNFALASSRARMPVTTTRTAARPASTPKIPNFRPETGALFSVGMRGLRFGVDDDAVLPVYHAEDNRHKHQSGRRCKDQATDYRSAERRVLLAAIAEAERHRGHADDHRERRHQHRAKTDKPGLDRGRDRVAQFFIALAGKADHQHAVGGGDAHA